MGFIKKNLLKVIEWKDNSQDTIVHRYVLDDRYEIMNGCELIVQESQVAILTLQGQIGDVYGPGAHKLTTGNMPILTHLAAWKYGFDSPFKADVYFINTKQFTNMKWGTTSKITLRDADFGVLRVGARGTYSFKVDDASVFMKEIFGSSREYTTTALIEYFKSQVVTNFSSVLGKLKIPAMDIPARLNDISDEVKAELVDDFASIGLKIPAFYVEAISLPEEVEQAIDRRSATGIFSDVVDTYTKVATADALKDAAKNPGGGMASSGVGLAAGIAMANSMMGSMNQTNQQAQQPQQAAANQVKCTACGSFVPKGKFCCNCGAKMNEAKFCQDCGTKLDAGAKFCPNCGKKVE